MPRAKARAKESDKFPCNYKKCKKRFLTIESRDAHVKQVHVFEHFCSYKNCEKSFRSAALLRAHYMTHTLQLKCDECEKIFNNRSNLTRHTRIHSNEKPYRYLIFFFFCCFS